MKRETKRTSKRSPKSTKKRAARKLAGRPAKRTVKRTVKRATKSATKRTTKRVTKRPIKRAARPAKRVAKKSTKRVTKRVIKRPVKRVAKRVVKRPVKRTTKRVVKRPVKRVAKRVAKRPAKRTKKVAAKKAFRRGDVVMHWTYGLGKIVRLENRHLLGHNTLYYAVQVRDMTVWVPADDQLESRLRKPSSKGKLRKLRKLLSRPGATLPQDRHERKTLLVEMLRDGRAESLCRAIRSLIGFSKVHPLNDNDQALLRRAQTALLAEWGHALSVPPEQAEAQLRRVIGIPPPGG